MNKVCQPCCIDFSFRHNMADHVNPENIRDLLSKPCQSSDLRFPSRSFGIKSSVHRSFQSTAWVFEMAMTTTLATKDCTRCFSCCTAVKDGRARVTAQVEATFRVEEFTNWKKATGKFAKHEKSDFHTICLQAVLSTVDVGDMPNPQAATDTVHYAFLGTTRSRTSWWRG